MTATSNLVSGFAAGMSSGPGEYAIATRFRHKLVLSYLSQQRLHPVFQSMVQQTNAHMCGDHLRRLVVRGQWVDALEYLHRFNSRRTVASNALHFFLHTLWALAAGAASAASAAARKNGSVNSGAQTHAFSTVASRGGAKLRSVVKGIIASPAQCVALNSPAARIMAGMIAYRLAREDPDLNRLMQLPGDGLTLPHHVLPIINPRPRRHLKRLPGRRAPGTVIARLYLNKRKSMHSSSPNTPDECIKAGKHQNQLQSVGRVPAFLMPLETAPVAPVLQTTSVPNAGAPVSSLIMSGTLTNQAKKMGISSAQNTVLQLAETSEAMPV